MLLDTHVFLWLVGAPDRLSPHLDVFGHDSTELILSAASSWEIALKDGLGTLPLPEPAASYVPEAARRIGARPVAIEHADTLAVAAMPQHHHDPFDHLLLTTARRLDAVLATADAALAAHDVPLLRVG